MPPNVFLDECGVTTDLIRRYGRSPRGTRLRDHTPCSHRQTRTVVAALRLEGYGRQRSSMGSFLAYVEQVLVPTLRPGDVVVLDNLAVHKQPESQWPSSTRARIRFLPPYRPAFNPIELAFAKLKAFLRAARPRHFEQVLRSDRDRARPLHPRRLRELRPALRLSHCYVLMKTL